MRGGSAEHARILARASLAVLLALVAVQLFVTDSRKLPLQTAVFMLELAVSFALQLADKAREKCELPKLWLIHSEFLLDEHCRLNQNIRLDDRNSALLCVAIICLALYAAPFPSAEMKAACWAATEAAVLVL